MLTINIYSPSALQTTSAILKEAISAGMSVQDVIGVIDRRMEELLPVPVQNHNINEARQCPSCGIGLLFPVKNAEGLHILGCRRCRYSEVIR